MNKNNISQFLFIAASALSTVTYFRPVEANITYTDVLLIISLLFLLRVKLKLSNIFNNYFTLKIYIASTILFFLGFYISILNDNPENFLKSFIQYLFCLYLLPLHLSMLLRINKKIVIYSTSAMISVLALSGYFGFILSINSIDYLINSELSSSSGRYSGFAGNPNIYAGLIGITFPLALHYTSTFNKKIFFSFFIYGGYTAGLLSAGSFGGILTSASSILIYTLLNGNFKKSILFLALMTATLTLTALHFGTPEIFQKRIISSVQDHLNDSPSRLGSLDERVKTSQEALNMFAESPIIGVGLDNYIHNSEFRYTVHNTLLLVGAEGGIISLFGLLIITSIPLINIFSKNKVNRILISSSVSFFAALLLTMQVFPHIYLRAWFIPYFLMITLCNEKLYTGKNKATLSDRNSPS